VDASTRLVKQVRRGLLDPDGAMPGLVVAVSGGPDSVALLRAVVAARGDRAAGPLVVAHLNHQLRGADSDADEEFVAGLHAQLVAAGVPDLSLCRHRFDVAGLARQEGANLEAVARRVRYQWLAEVARNEGVGRIATGHTADDQAETALHRLLRGTGLQGLRGIAARRELEPGIEVVRPLLETTRAEILAYLEALRQPYREDGSNLDRRFTRNRIRHELLPHLAEHYNPAVVRVLGRLARQAEEAHRETEAAACALLREAEKPRAGAMLVFEAAVLAGKPRFLVRAALRLAWAREGWPMGEMGHAAWERLTDLVYDPDGAAVDLPGSIRARRRERVVQITPIQTV
jgi:tRNA(Ile)-lysidine synthase